MYPTTRQNKYGNRKAEVDGITFDSRKEARRYADLKLLQKAHAIYDLKLQVPFELQPKFKDEEGHIIKPITYIADFTYYKDGKLVIEDVKSDATKRDAVYRLKKKMMAYRGFYITEV